MNAAPAEPEAHSDDPSPAGIGAVAGTAVAAVLVIACCAGPALIAAGAVAGIGARLSGSWITAVATGAAVTALAFTVRTRRRRRAGRAECCPPVTLTATGARAPTGQDRVSDPADQEGPHRR